MIMSDHNLDKLNNAANNETKIIIDEWLASNKLTVSTPKLVLCFFYLRKLVPISFP